VGEFDVKATSKHPSSSKYLRNEQVLYLLFIKNQWLIKGRDWRDSKSAGEK